MTKAEHLLLGLLDVSISAQNPLNRTAKQPTTMAEFAIKQAMIRNMFGDYQFGFVDCSKLQKEVISEITAICDCYLFCNITN